jgi:NTE family protein
MGTTAFVLSGGGNLGAVQAGQLQALLHAGITPDLIIGTSVGAVNGAFLAGACHREGCERLAQTWTGLRRNDVFPARPFVGLSGLVGRKGHLVEAHSLRRLLRAHVRFDRLEDAPIALHVVACDLRTGGEVLLSTGSVIDAVCASAAIPGIFPPVVIDGHVLVDGGIANNTPISHAVEMGAETIWVLSCGYACALPAAPKGAAAIALQAVSLMIHQRLAMDVDRYRSIHDLRVLPTLCPLNVSPTDFTQSVRLMSDAFTASKQWLEAGMPDQSSMFGRPHHH